MRHSDLDRVELGQVIMVCISHLMTQYSNKFKSKMPASETSTETYLQFLRRGMEHMTDAGILPCCVHDGTDIPAPCGDYTDNVSGYYLDRGAKLGRWEMAMFAMLLGRNDKSRWTYDQTEEIVQMLATPRKVLALSLAQIDKHVKDMAKTKAICALAKATVANAGKLPSKPCALIPGYGALICEFIQVMTDNWETALPQAPHLFMTCLARRIVRQGGISLLRQLARDTMASCNRSSNKYQLCERLVVAPARNIILSLQLRDPYAPEAYDYTAMMSKLRLTSCVRSSKVPSWLSEPYRPDTVEIISGVNMMGARGSRVDDLMEFLTRVLHNAPDGSKLHVQLPENASTGLVPMCKPCVTIIHNNKTTMNRGRLEFFGIHQTPCPSCAKPCFGSICQSCSAPTKQKGPWTPRYQFRCECGSLKPWSRIPVHVTIKFGACPAFYLSQV